MNPLMHLNKDQVKRHILFWSIIAVYLNLDSPVPGSWAAKIMGGAIECLNYVGVFYGISLLGFPKFWKKNRIYLLFFFVLICYCLYSAVTYFNYLKIIPALGGHSWHQEYPISNLLLHNIFYFLILCSSGAASFYYRNGVYQFTIQAEKEKLFLVKELNFLKNQFNSHITFNFLNYCYSKIHQKQPQTAESVALFSDILRYSLEAKSEEKVLLSDEIANTENFIHLQKLLNPNVHAQFNYESETGFYILPRILITLVEIAFKHRTNKNSQFHIDIDLKVANNELVFTIKNKVDADIDMANNLIDIGNVTQMLSLYDNNNYQLTKEENNGYVIIKLCITECLPTPESEAYTTSYPKRIKTSSRNIWNKTTDSEKFVSKPLMRLNKKQIQTHILAWAFIIIYAHITNEMPGTLTARVIGCTLYNFNYMFVFYGIGLYIFPKYWEGKRLLLIIDIFFILLLYWINSYFIFKKIIPFLGGFTDIQEFTFYDFLQVRFYFFILSGSAGAASFFSRYGLYKVKQKADKEKMLLAKELSILKDQFNSQFTFNFLNYCYNNVSKFSSETAESIKLFADMLRYTFQTKADEKVALATEIIYINDFISLQKILSSKVYIDFHYKGNLSNKQILPRILITYVENAFKHGLTNDPQHPITINLIVDKNTLLFTVINKINLNKAILSSHTGLQNVHQLLELYYPNNYTLKAHESEGFFVVELKLDFV